MSAEATAVGALADAPAVVPRARLALPELLLLLAVATAATPLYVNPVGHFTLRSSDLLVALAGLAWLVDAVRGRAAPFVGTAVDAPLVVLAAAMLASASVADDRLAFLRALRPWLFFGAAFWLLAAHLRDVERVRRFLAASFVGLGGQLLFGVFQLFAGETGMTALLRGPLGRLFYEPDVVQDRLRDFYFNWAMNTDDPVRALGLTTYPSGTTINSANFSVLMAGLALVLVALQGHTPRRQRATLLFAMLASALMFLSFKRSGWVAFVVGAPFVGLASGRRALVRAAVVAAFVGLLFGTCSVMQPLAAHSFSARAGSLRAELAGGSEGNSRIELWKHGARLLRASPVLGVGLGNWQHHGPWVPTRRGWIQWSNPESSLVGLAVETGVFGVLAYVTLLLTLLGLALKLARQGGPDAALAAAAGVGVLVIAVGASLNDLLTDDKVWPLFATYAAVVVSLWRLARAKASSGARA